LSGVRNVANANRRISVAIAMPLVAFFNRDMLAKRINGTQIHSLSDSFRPVEREQTVVLPLAAD